MSLSAWRHHGVFGFVVIVACLGIAPAAAVPLNGNVTNRIDLGELHMAAAPQAQVISGIVVAGGVECPLLQLEDGQRFALQGLASSRVAPGAALTVRGFPIRVSTCQQGPAFQVLEVIG
jgi:hypothetical protein